MLLSVVLMVCQVALGHAADQAAEVLVAFCLFSTPSVLRNLSRTAGVLLASFAE